MITKISFDDWLDDIGGDSSLRTIAEKSDIPVNTLSVQRSKNNVPASTVLKIARAYGRNPLAELKKFDEYRSIPIASFAKKMLLF